MIIDGKNLILGRLGSFVSKQALNGEKIDIVNCESVIITGKKDYLLKEVKRKNDMGIHSKGPFIFKSPDRYVKRSIRGMLPYKKERGEAAYKNIKCHIGVPDEFKDQKIITIESADVKKMPSLDYLKVIDVCRKIGAKI